MAEELGDELFQCNLDDASRKKAKEQLNEINDKDRRHAVQNLRKLVLQQNWYRTPTEFEFLLKFLRVRKYSQLAARESIENYWTHKSTYPKFFKNVDPRDPKLQEILRAGFYLIPKSRDKDGCRIIIGSMGNLSVDRIKKEWGIENVYRATMMLYEWLIRDENVQVNGIKFFIDYTGMTMALATVFSGEQQNAMMKFFQKALPIRMKAMYLYNEPPFFDAIYALMSPFLSQKMKNRMHLVGKNMARVYEHVDMSVLPDEYLPDDYEGPRVGSMAKIRDEMMEDMTSPDFVEYMVNLSSDKYGADLKKKAEAGSGDVPVASFRKLAVD